LVPRITQYCLHKAIKPTHPRFPIRIPEFSLRNEAHSPLPRYLHLSQDWEIPLSQVNTESQHFFIATGRCEGRIAGNFQGANHPQRRGDGTYLPNFQGVIETEDRATIYFDYRGYGRAYPAGRRQIVVSAAHLSSHEKYKWLNDSLCVEPASCPANRMHPPN
jgi:hypothetical protein